MEIITVLVIGIVSVSNKVKMSVLTEYFKFIGYYFRAYNIDNWLNN